MTSAFEFKTNQTNQNKERYNHVLTNLQDYMFTESLIQQIIQASSSLLDKEKEKENVIQIEKKKNTIQTKNTNNNTTQHGKQQNSNYKNNNAIMYVKINNLDFMLPKQRDTLFWCFYIMKYGDIQYETLDVINVVIEKKLKYECIEKIRENKQIIKTYKYATLTHLENQLANEKNIDLSTFLTLCVLENMNVFYIHNKTWFELRMNDSDNFFILNKMDGKGNGTTKHGYSCLACTTTNPIMNQQLETYKTNMFQITNIEKPLKALSSYKVSELTEICNQLGLNIINVDNGKNKNKAELYELLVQYFGL